MIHTKFNYIYKTTNLINDKIYVGQHRTNNLKDSYLGSGIVLRQAVKKYGRKNFKCEILENCLPCIYNLNNLEQFWIKELNSLYPNGYNISTGGTISDFNKGKKRSPESKKRISDAKRGKFTHKWSESQREKFIKTRTGF